MRAVEGQRQQQACGRHGHQQSGDAAADRQQYAFGERLRDDLPPRRADRQAHRGLPAARHCARQQQVRDIGARNQQHQPANRKQDLQAAPVFFLHLGHARARGNHVDRLVWEAFGSCRASSWRDSRNRVASIAAARRSGAATFRRSKLRAASGRSCAARRRQADAATRLSPSSSGSCCNGIQISGGSLRSVSPKNPGGATPMMVKDGLRRRSSSRRPRDRRHSGLPDAVAEHRDGRGGGLSSSGVNTRPPNARTPSVEK